MDCMLSWQPPGICRCWYMCRSTKQIILLVHGFFSLPLSLVLIMSTVQPRTALKDCNSGYMDSWLDCVRMVLPTKFTPLETTLGGRGPWWWPRKLWLAKHGWKRKMDAVMCTLWTCTVIRVLFYFILFSFLLVLLTHRWSQELSRLPLSLIFLKGSSLRYYNHRY